MPITIPKQIKDILSKFEQNKFEAYAVGGCVRDLLIDRKPKDWDITTNAQPEQVQKLFPDSFYKNDFGTVTVKTKSADKSLQEIEITTYRSEKGYSDKRHPDQISFTKRSAEDLARRDFTINAILADAAGQITDPFKGRADLAKKIIRTVNNPSDRFNEDALRMLRAIRLSVELDFDIEPKTLAAIKKNAGWIQAIAKERIRDEFSKMLMSTKPDKAIELMKETGLLSHIIPELEKGIGIDQNRHHIYTIYEHAVLSLKFAAENDYGLEVRLAALFHDVAKPQTKQGQGHDATFYNHDIVGAKIATRILDRLKFPKQVIEKVGLLIRYHMFVYNVDEVTEAGVRRLLRKVGPDNMDELIHLREADRIGSGVPKAVPYKLRHLRYIIDKVSKDPISAKMLKIDGNDIMDNLDIEPGPRLGLLIEALLAEVIEDPKLNIKKRLLAKAKELNKLPDKDLTNRSKIVEEKKQEEDDILKNKHWVK